MVAAALLRFVDSSAGPRPVSLSRLPRTPELIAEIRRLHVRQYRPRVIAAAVADWVRSRGGEPGRVLRRIRLPGTGADPHVLCFGPRPNRRFFRCLVGAHAVAPYRVEAGDDEVRVYVYDPNYPEDGERYVAFRYYGTFVRFAYDGFGTAGGWGISLVPLSAIGNTAGLLPDEVTLDA